VTSTRQPTPRGLLLATRWVSSTAAQAFGGLVLIDEPLADRDRVALGPAVLAFPDHAGASKHKVWLIPGIEYCHLPAYRSHYGFGI
jgi:hypothetical protein